MRARITAFLIFAAALQTAACGSHYSGDGTFTDFGSHTANGRYFVDLGPVDLSRASKRSYQMLGLPSTEFTIGLEHVDVSAGCDAVALGAERVRIEVTTGDGAVVVAEEAPLNAWVSSSSLVYRRGVELQEPAGDDGVYRLVRSGTRASGGWGTYFTPSSWKTYVVRLEVLDPHGTSGCESRLAMLGGGWK